MNNCLAIDTSDQCACIGLQIDDHYYHAEIDNPKAQAEQLLRIIDTLLAQANTSLKSLDYIAIAIGPGSFTGLRVGISAAQALAYALALPVVAVGSLQILAQQAYLAEGLEKVLITRDARMQEYYWGQFELQNGFMQQIGDIRVNAMDIILAENSNFAHPEERQSRVSKDELKFSLRANGELALKAQPKSLTLTQLAQEQYKKGETLSPAALVPLYVRNKVAEKSKSGRSAA